MNPNGSANFKQATNGIEEYFEDLGVLRYSTSWVYGSYLPAYEMVVEQISDNVPLVTAMYSAYNQDCYLDHAVVTYGYTVEKRSSTGEVLSIYYHTHNGWKNSNNNLKSYNYLWICDAFCLLDRWEEI